MTKQNLDILPTVTVHNLLVAYPQLEEVLIGIAPPFKKLKNPFLRRTIARVATIRHISSVGGVPLDELINRLRKEVGQPEISVSYEDEDYFGEKPEWYSPGKVVCTINEGEMKNKDKMALSVILKEAKKVKQGEIIKLSTSFLPAPGIDILKSKGYSVWTKKENESVIKSYFLKP